jgi:hypothetical protein
MTATMIDAEPIPVTIANPQNSRVARSNFPQNFPQLPAEPPKNAFSRKTSRHCGNLLAMAGDFFVTKDRVGA